jgi:putative ABC transport system permease protein
MGNLVSTTNGLFAPLGRTDLYVSCTPPDVTPAGPILPADLPDKLKSIPGVESVIPTQFGYANLDSRRLLVVGLANGSVSPFFDQITSQTKDKLLAGEGVLVSRQLAREFGLSAGGQFELNTPTGPRAVTVLAEVQYLTFDAGVVVMPLDRMEQWFERPGATYYEVHYKSSADIGGIEKAVRNLAPQSASVYTGAQEVQALKATIVQIGALAVGMQWIVAVVSAVALLNIFMLAVLQRRRELGVQRATGASSRLVGKGIFMEVLASGLVGALVGVAIGAVAQYIGTAGLSATTAVNVTYAFDARTALYGLGALALCVLGALPPVSRAARMNIIEAVSNE